MSTDDCWLFAGTINKNDYGHISAYGKANLAHRLVYESLVKDIPDGLELDHLCKVRRCINPNHLEPVTPQENMERRYGKGLCKRGHKLTPDNVYTGIKDKKTGRVGRQCRTCKDHPFKGVI